MWSTLSTNKKQLARESFPALSACSCDCFEFLLVPLDCMPLLWVTWLTRLVYLYSFWYYDAQLKTFQLDDILTYHGVTDQGPLWCGLSATFQISWVNSTILLNSSSAAYKNWRKKQFIFLLSTMAGSQILYLLFRDRGEFTAFFIFFSRFALVLTRPLYSHARQKTCTDRLCRLEPLLSYPHKSSTQRIRTEKASHFRTSTWTQLKMKN